MTISNIFSVGSKYAINSIFSGRTLHLAFLLFFAFPVQANDTLWQLKLEENIRFGNVIDVSSALREKEGIEFLPSYFEHEDIRLLDKALIEATGARNASREMVDLLIDFGADVNAKPQSHLPVPGAEIGSTPLSAALSGIFIHSDAMESTPTTQHLISSGFYTMARTSKEDRVELARYLFDNGAEVNVLANGLPILQTALSVDADLGRYFLENGADPYIQQGESGKSISIIFRERIAEYQRLLDLFRETSRPPATQLPPEVSKVDPVLGKRLLNCISIGNCKVQQVREMIKMGADVNFMNDSKNTVLAATLRSIGYNFGEGTMKVAAELAKTLDKEITPRAEMIEILRYLVSKGANVNQHLIIGGPSLLYSHCLAIGDDVVKILLDAGANTDDVLDRIERLHRGDATALKILDRFQPKSS